MPCKALHGFAKTEDKTCSVSYGLLVVAEIAIRASQESKNVEDTAAGACDSHGRRDEVVIPASEDQGLIHVDERVMSDSHELL